MSRTIKSEHALFEEFPPVSRHEWEEVIARDLNGADYRQRLRWHTGEGIDVLPFYRHDDLSEGPRPAPVPTGKAHKNDWSIRYPVFDQAPSEANANARSALERGADALQFKMIIRRTDGMLGGDLEGTAIRCQQDFEDLLDGIDLEQVALHFDCGTAAPLLLAMLYNEVERRGLDPASVTAGLLYDPCAYTASRGHLPKPADRFLEDGTQMVRFCNRRLPGVRPLGVDARGYHNAGGTIVQELALAMATGSEYLAGLAGPVIPAGDIAKHIHFSFSVGSNYFLEIAKFRAARLLWNQVVSAYGVDGGTEGRPPIHGETSEWNKTIYDPYTNMLRTTTEGMSAAIAGCDSLTIHPFDLAAGQADAFSGRIACNTQVIMKEEAYLDRVYDPSAGSYYVEVLTDKIASEAWNQFQELEQQGGLRKAITSGVVAGMIAESAEKRNEAIEHRKRVFVGTNQYPDPDERQADGPDTPYRTASMGAPGEEWSLDKNELIPSLAEALADGAQLGDLVPQLQYRGKQLFRPIAPYRGSRAFEDLRMATERHQSTPTVLLVPMGNREARKARATFAANFFGCAGYSIEDPIGFDTLDEAVKQVGETDPELVVLCSSDSGYSELVEPFCERLDALEHRPIVVVAGAPGSEAEADNYRTAGVDAFIHRKSNVLETLWMFHRKLDIA